MKYLVRGQNAASMTMCSHDGPKQEGGGGGQVKVFFAPAVLLVCFQSQITVPHVCGQKRVKPGKIVMMYHGGKVVILLRPVISTNVKGIVNVVGSLLCVCGCRQNAIVNL